MQREPKSARAIIRRLLPAAALAAAVIIPCAVWGQTGDSSGQAAAREDGGSVLLDRPPVPITPPTSEKPVKGAKVAISDLPIVDRRCRMKTDPQSGWAILEFENAPGLPALDPHRLLPCRRLEQMERLASQDPAAVFRVSGEVTVFQNQAYILPRTLAVDSASAEAQAYPAALPPSRGAGKKAARAAVKSVPDESASDANASSSEGIMKALTRNRPAKPVLPAAESAELIPETQSVAPLGEAPAAPERDAMVVDRLVRAFRGGDPAWWEARFESDNTLQDRPIRLLPCRLLERAQKATGRLVVTGEITYYKGRAYLLLRKLLPERDMGQL